MAKRTPEERFWAKVQKTETCWLWTASRAGELPNGGYGLFYTGKGMRVAHRVAYEWLVGPVPEGLQLDHLCRVRHCVNPDHLEPVTNRENSLRGASNKLSDEDRAEIRRLHATGRLSQAALGRRYKVTDRNIRFVLKAAR